MFKRVQEIIAAARAAEALADFLFLPDLPHQIYSVQTAAELEERAVNEIAVSLYLCELTLLPAAI